MEYVFAHDDVGYGISVNNFGEIEDSFVLWHRGHEQSGDVLIEMHAQDTTIPGQSTEQEKLSFCSMWSHIGILRGIYNGLYSRSLSIK
eukprot:UN15545